MNNNETAIKDDIDSAINKLSYNTFCTNCGGVIENSNKCFNCGVKTKKNYRKFCVYCGGLIGANKKCDKCGTLSRNTLTETFARLFINIHIIINYVVALFCWICALISVYKYEDEAKFLLILGFVVLIATLLVHVLVYRKKQMQKIKQRLFSQKRKVLKLICIYLGVFIYINSVLNISMLCGVVRILNTDEQRGHEIQMTESEKQQIIDKESNNMYDNYQDAMKSISRGEFEEAYKLLTDADYPDSAEIINNIFPSYKKILISKCKIGETVCFGRYPQLDAQLFKNDIIEWRVLDIKNNKALLISEYAHIPDNDVDVNAFWFNEDPHFSDKYDVKTWLNEVFINDAFLPIEQNIIDTVSVEGEKHTENGETQSFVTDVKLFLLSDKEAMQYFENDKERKVRGTAYADKKCGVYKEYDPYQWNWLLRTHTTEFFLDDCVAPDGTIASASLWKNNSVFGIRPAMWINLK